MLTDETVHNVILKKEIRMSPNVMQYGSESVSHSVMSDSLQRHEL